MPPVQQVGRFGIELQGLNAAITKMERLSHRIVTSSVAKAVRAGAAPIVKAGKQNAPRRHGYLKRSITQKVNRYRGKVLDVIGPAKQKYPDGSNPVNYAHLVEGGTKPHLVGKRQHPGAKANPFLRRAIDATQGQGLRAFEAKLTAEVNAQAAAVAAGAGV